MHGFHQSQVANCNSATGCTKPSQTYSLAPLSYSTSSPSSSASSRLLLSCTSEYPKLERVIITTCKNLATERGLCTQCTPSKVTVRNSGRLTTPDSLVTLSAALPVDRQFQVRLCTSTYCLLEQNLTCNSPSTSEESLK